LDEMEEATGLHRKSLIRLMSWDPCRQRHRDSEGTPVAWPSTHRSRLSRRMVMMSAPNGSRATWSGWPSIWSITAS